MRPLPYNLSITNYRGTDLELKKEVVGLRFQHFGPDSVCKKILLELTLIRGHPAGVCYRIDCLVCE